VEAKAPKRFKQLKVMRNISFALSIPIFLFSCVIWFEYIQGTNLALELSVCVFIPAAILYLSTLLLFSLKCPTCGNDYYSKTKWFPKPDSNCQSCGINVFSIRTESKRESY
jgi:hypothetical protein